jgi:hypothetical protein
MIFFCYICKEKHLNFKSVSSHLQKEHQISKASKDLNLKCVRSEQCLKSYCNFYSLKRHSDKCHVTQEQSHSLACTNNSKNRDQTVSIVTTVETAKKNIEKKTTAAKSCEKSSEGPIKNKTLIDSSLLDNLQGIPQEKVDKILKSIHATFNNVFESLTLKPSELENIGRSEQIVQRKIQQMKRIFEIEFTCINSTYKRTKLIEQKSSYVAPVHKSIGLQWTKVKGELKLKQNLYSYVPIASTLISLFKNPSFYKTYFDFQIQNCNRDDLDGYRSGENFKKNLLFQNHPDALQLQLYYDDVEICNCIGSKKKIHKLGGVYLRIMNLPSFCHANLKYTSLVALFKTKDLSHEGVTYDTILEPFIKEVKALETTGLLINANKTIFGTLGSIVHDNLAANSLLGFVESFSATYCCRFCTMSKEKAKISFQEDTALLRTKEQYIAQTKEDCSNVKISKGIKRLNSFCQLKYFDFIDNCTVDPMHDILEGVGPFILKLLIKELMFVYKLSLETINDKIQSFNYGYLFQKTKPSKIGVTSFNASASQTWCLLVHFPFVFGYLVNDILLKKWEGLTSLLKIMKIVFSSRVPKNSIQELKELVELHLFIMINEFEVNLIPKHHFLIHYFRILMKMGPLHYYSTMRFESFHCFFTQAAIQAKNFKNITFTLSTKHQQKTATNWEKLKVEPTKKHGKKTVPINSKSKKIRNMYNVGFDFKILTFYQEGFLYRPNFFILDDENKYKRINFILSDCNEKIFFLCSNFDTISFDDFHCAHKIKKIENSFSIVQLDSLKSKNSYEMIISKKDNEKYIINKFL